MKLTRRIQCILLTPVEWAITNVLTQSLTAVQVHWIRAKDIATFPCWENVCDHCLVVSAWTFLSLNSSNAVVLYLYIAEEHLHKHTHTYTYSHARARARKHLSANFRIQSGYELNWFMLTWLTFSSSSNQRSFSLEETVHSSSVKCEVLCDTELYHVMQWQRVTVCSVFISTLQLHTK